MGLSAVLVEETIAILQTGKLVRHNARSHWPDNTTFNSPFSEYSDKQVHIVHAFVQILNLLYYLLIRENRLSPSGKLT